MKLVKYKLTLITAICLMTAPFLVLAAQKATLQTNEPLSISSESALLEGKVTNDGNCPKMNVWFEFGDSPSLGSATEIKSFEGTGLFKTVAQGLEPCRRYYFRPAAKNNQGVSYGSTSSFLTFCDTDVSVRKQVRNISKNEQTWADSVQAELADYLTFRITVQSHLNSPLSDIMVKDTLPLGINYRGELKINDLTDLRDITASAINIGALAAKQAKTITFKAQVSEGSGLVFGENVLLNNVLVYNTENAVSDTAAVRVDNKLVKTTPASIETGIASDLLTSVFLPLFIALFLVFVFKSKLIAFDIWAERRKDQVAEYRAKRQLAKRIRKHQKRS